MSDDNTIPVPVIRQGEDHYCRFVLKNPISQYQNIFLLIKDENEKVFRTFSLFEHEGCITGYLTIYEEDEEGKTLSFLMSRTYTSIMNPYLYLFELKVKLITDENGEGEEDDTLFNTIFEENFFRVRNSKTRNI